MGHSVVVALAIPAGNTGVEERVGQGQEHRDVGVQIVVTWSETVPLVGAVPGRENGLSYALVRGVAPKVGKKRAAEHFLSVMACDG